MWQIRLKAVVQKLSIVSIYLLFLSVQLNLKYTFSDNLFSDYSNSQLQNSKTVNDSRSTANPLDGKPVVQKLRLNKRYVHEDVYLVFSLENKLINDFYVKLDNPVTPVPTVANAAIGRAFMRGPPPASFFSC
jgi:hypothetical protein